MSAATCPRHFLMPCPVQPLRLVQNEHSVGRVTGEATNAKAEAAAFDEQRRPTAWRPRLQVSERWLRVSRFAGGVLIGAALWAMVFAASAATQFSVPG
jgi:hypothetical protein